MKKQLRILYAAGPGDVIGTYKYWKKDKDDQSQVAMTYSGQFYDVCKQLNAKAYVIAAYKKPGFLKEGLFKIEQKHVLFQNSKSPIIYHLGQIYYGLRLLISGIRFNANVALVNTGTHWFMFYFMSLFGIKVIPTLHCTFWPAGFRSNKKFKSFIQKLNGLFWKNIAIATICVSPECERQIKEISKDIKGPIYHALAQYKKNYLDLIPKPKYNIHKPFIIMFAGRIEKNKGVFDLLSIANQLQKSYKNKLIWEICGEGSSYNELKKLVKNKRLQQIFRLRGKLNRNSMKERYKKSHVIIAPTTSEFAEGLNKVVVEGILIGRPVITSKLSNALDILEDAIIEVKPDDIKSYKEAILKLYKNKDFYNKKQKACLKYQSQFYNRNNSWGAKLKNILLSIQKDIK